MVLCMGLEAASLRRPSWGTLPQYATGASKESTICPHSSAENKCIGKSSFLRQTSVYMNDAPAALSTLHNSLRLLIGGSSCGTHWDNMERPGAISSFFPLGTAALQWQVLTDNAIWPVGGLSICLHPSPPLHFIVLGNEAPK